VPIYEYICKKCGHEFEAIQGFSDKPLKKCEKCEGQVRKLVSQSSFHLKGSGWYVTDYAKTKHPGSQTTDKSDSSSTANENSSGKKSDSSSPAKEKSPDSTKSSTKKKSKET
jgi:putative FmdB family regulatory protein